MKKTTKISVTSLSTKCNKDDEWKKSKDIWYDWEKETKMIRLTALFYAVS